MSHRCFWNADCSSLLRATVRRVLSQQATPLIREPQQHLFAPSALAGNELQMAAGVTCSHLQELQLGSQHCNSWTVSLWQQQQQEPPLGREHWQHLGSQLVALEMTQHAVCECAHSTNHGLVDVRVCFINVCRRHKLTISLLCVPRCPCMHACRREGSPHPRADLCCAEALQLPQGHRGAVCREGGQQGSVRSGTGRVPALQAAGWPGSAQVGQGAGVQLLEGGRALEWGWVWARGLGGELPVVVSNGSVCYTRARSPQQEWHCPPG
jgi:hypothetical protein